MGIAVVGGCRGELVFVAIWVRPPRRVVPHLYDHTGRASVTRRGVRVAAAAMRSPRADVAGASRRSAIEDGEVEPPEPLGVGEDVDLGDLPAADGEAGDGERAPVPEVDGAGGTVDQ